jgi:3-hydroxymyristoyl/3-hydroxydecanoyl-(acyl carrier protein) dehydratase
MTQTLDLPLDDRWFEGHFPGRPILPGVSQMALVLDALSRRQGKPVVLNGIGFARMRQPVVPGDPLQLTVDERPDNAVRVALSRNGTVVTNAELLVGQAPGAVPPTMSAGGASMPDAPPVEGLLPHQPPMRFVTSLVSEYADGLTCSARIPFRCPLVVNGHAPALAAIEAAAQTAALWEATRRRRDGGPTAPRLGYLVGLRDVTFFAQTIPAEASFAATIRLEAATLALAHYAIRIDLGAAVVLHGTLATFLTDETMPA